MDQHKKELMSKNGQMVVELGREFLSYSKGQRLPTISDYVEKYSVARGTIQSAIKYLSNIGAVSLKARGHLGTYLIGIDYKELWNISGFGSVLGIMPLPYTKRYEGIATGLYQAFHQAEIPFNLAYMRGAKHRLDMLDKGLYHFAIVSKLAIENIEKEKRKFKIIYEFPETSYVTEHGLILKRGLNKLENGMKIALDESSTDQSLLTKKECQGFNVKYVPMTYNQILNNLEIGKVDAAVWNLEELQEKNISSHTIPLQNEEAKKIGKAATKAVIAINFTNSFIGEIMKRTINFSKISEIQKLVVGHKMIPMY